MSLKSKNPFNFNTSKLSTFLLKFDITAKESFNEYIFSDIFFLHLINIAFLFLLFY